MISGIIIYLFSASLLFQIIQVGVFPILIAQLLSNQDVDGFTIGIFLAVSWVAVLLVGPIVPRLIRHTGFNAANASSSLATGAAVILLLASTAQPVVLLSAILMGIGLIIRWVSCDSLVVELSSTENRGRMIGLHEALMGLGIAIAPLLFVFFNLDGVLWSCVVIAVAGQLLFSLLASQASISAEPPSDKKSTSIPYSLIFVALAAAFVAGFIENSAIALFPLYFESFGLNLATSALLVSAFGFGGTVLQPPLGYVSDRKGYRFAQMLCAIAILVTGAIAVFYQDGIWVLLPALFLMGGAAGGFNTLAVIQAGRELKRSTIPSAMAAIAMLYTLGSIVGPVISGAMIELPQKTAMLMEFMTIAALLLLLMLLRPGKPHDRK